MAEPSQVPDQERARATADIEHGRRHVGEPQPEHEQLDVGRVLARHHLARRAAETLAEDRGEPVERVVQSVLRIGQIPLPDVGRHPHERRLDLLLGIGRDRDELVLRA